MSNEHDASNGAAPTSQPGPDLLAERTLMGIFVHVLGLLTSFVGPLLVYAVSDHEFTRRNARNATNWQLFILATMVGTIAAFGGVFVADVVLPDPIVAALFLVVFAVFFAVFVAMALNLVFPLVATGKAIFGGAWTYPIAPDFFDLDRSAVDVDVDRGIAWWKGLVVYVLAAPVLFAFLVRFALVEPPESGIWVGAFLVTVLFVTIASLFTLLLLYLDVETVKRADSPWEPASVPYLVVPIVGGVAVYLVAAYPLGTENPSGDGVYGFATVLWIVTVAYLYRRRDSLGTP